MLHLVFLPKIFIQGRKNKFHTRKHIHSRFILKSQTSERTQMSISMWWTVYAKEYYRSVMKRSGILIYTAVWMNIKIIMLSEQSQASAHIVCLQKIPTHPHWQKASEWWPGARVARRKMDGLQKCTRTLLTILLCDGFLGGCVCWKLPSFTLEMHAVSFTWTMSQQNYERNGTS